MKVTILEGCSACGACEAISPEVFSVDTIAHVDKSNVKGNEQACIDAALVCPVNVIWLDDV